MVNVRMIFMEADSNDVDVVADVMRSAFGGLPVPAHASPVEPAEPAAVPVAAPTILLREPYSSTPRKAAPAQAPKKPIAKKAATAKQKPAPPAARVTTEDSLPDRVLSIIRKGPARTSGEIYDFLRKAGYTGSNGAVYQACKFWRDKGLVISKPDDSPEGGGVVKQYPAS